MTSSTQAGIVVADRFHEMLSRLQENPDRISELDLVYQFVVLGERDGDQYEWQLRLQHGNAEVCRGRAPRPDMACTLTTQDFLSLTSGQVSGRDLFFSGRMQVEGNALLGMVLNRILS